jgi:hypothetical protein
VPLASPPDREKSTVTQPYGQHAFQPSVTRHAQRIAGLAELKLEVRSVQKLELAGCERTRRLAWGEMAASINRNQAADAADPAQRRAGCDVHISNDAAVERQRVVVPAENRAPRALVEAIQVKGRIADVGGIADRRCSSLRQLPAFNFETDWHRLDRPIGGGRPLHMFEDELFLH